MSRILHNAGCQITSLQRENSGCPEIVFKICLLNCLQFQRVGQSFRISKLTTRSHTTNLVSCRSSITHAQQRASRCGKDKCPTTPIPVKQKKSCSTEYLEKAMQSAEKKAPPYSSRRRTTDLHNINSSLHRLASRNKSQKQLCENITILFLWFIFATLLQTFVGW